MAARRRTSRRDELRGVALPRRIQRAPGECVDGEYKSCRAALQAALFNSSTLPARPPDFVLADGGPQVARAGAKYVMSGLPGPGNGTSVGAACAWENNLTAFVWTIHGKFFSLNSTVFWSLNTSSRAAVNYNPPPYKPGSGPHCPNPNAPW